MIYMLMIKELVVVVAAVVVVLIIVEVNIKKHIAIIVMHKIIIVCIQNNGMKSLPSLA